MEDWIRRQLIERQLPGTQSPVMFQRWVQLLFLHWGISPNIVQMTFPQGLQADRALFGLPYEFAQMSAKVSVGIRQGLSLR
jgi:uncharacterized protein YqjF (DUF2071 family)